MRKKDCKKGKMFEKKEEKKEGRKGRKKDWKEGNYSSKDRTRSALPDALVGVIS